MGLSPLSFSNSSFIRLILVGRPGLQSQSISIISASAASSPPSTWTGYKSYFINNELGDTFKFKSSDFFQSKFSWIGVILGWAFLNVSGISIDSINPVPMPFDIAAISFFWVGFGLLSIAKIYFLEGFFS